MASPLADGDRLKIYRGRKIISLPLNVFKDYINGTTYYFDPNTLLLPSFPLQSPLDGEEIVYLLKNNKSVPYKLSVVKGFITGSQTPNQITPVLSSFPVSASLDGSELITVRQGSSADGAVTLTTLQTYTGGGSPVITLNAPYLDTFAGDGPMTSRAGWVVSATTAQAGNIGVLSTLSGFLRGTNTAVGLGVMATHDSGAGSGESHVWIRMGETYVIGAEGGFIAHATLDVTNGITAMSDGDTVGPTHSPMVNATPTTRLINTPPVAGNVREYRTSNVSGTMRSRFYFGGRPYDFAADPVTGYDIAAGLGRAPNGIYGVTARIGAASVQMFSTVNTLTDRWISIINVSPIRSNVRELYVYGEYGGPAGDVAPLASEVVINGYTSSTEVLLGALTGVAITNFTAAGGQWSGTVPNPIAGAPYKLEVVWNYLVAGVPAFSNYQTCTLKNGRNVSVVIDAQSQGGFLAAGADAIAAPSNSFNFAMDTSAVRGKRLLSATGANTVYAHMAAEVQAYSPGAGFQLTNCSLGSNPQSARMPPTAQFFEAIEGIQATGGRPDIIIFAGGTNTEVVNDIYQNIITTANGYEDYLGMARGSMLFGISPEGSATSVGQEAVNRRLMWKLTRDLPARFKLVAYRHDVQHGYNPGGSPQIDTLHYMLNPDGTGYNSGYNAATTVGETEWARRLMRGVCFLLGLTTDDLLGPKIAVGGLARVSSTTFDVTLDASSIAAFDDTEIANTAYAGDFGGGIAFNTDPAFGAGTKVVPTNCVKQSKSVYRYTVPSTAGTLYARTNMINNPFNPGGVAAIDQSMTDRASMIRALKTGKLPVGLLPSYDVGGAGTDIDYTSA